MPKIDAVKQRQCMYMGGGQWQKPVLSTYYVFWIPTGTQPTGEWVSCNP